MLYELSLTGGWDSPSEINGGVVVFTWVFFHSFLLNLLMRSFIGLSIEKSCWKSSNLLVFASSKISKSLLVPLNPLNVFCFVKSTIFPSFLLSNFSTFTSLALLLAYRGFLKNWCSTILFKFQFKMENISILELNYSIEN